MRSGPQQDGKVGIRNYKAGRIDRSGERRVPEPPQEPSAELKPVEPQRRLQARLEKPLALLRVEPRPALHCGRDQIDAPHSHSLLKSGLGKRNTKNEKRKYAEDVRSRGPPRRVLGFKGPGDRIARPHRWEGRHPSTVPANRRGYPPDSRWRSLTLAVLAPTLKKNCSWGQPSVDGIGRSKP